MCGHSVVTLLWRSLPSPRSPGHQPSAATPTWSVHVYLCCTLTAFLLSLSAAMLPLMDAVPAGFRCLPLATFGERGAEYTVLDLGVASIAVTVSCVACLVSLVARIRASGDAHHHRETRDLACQIAGVICWIPGLCILIPKYFDTRHTARHTSYYLVDSASSSLRLALAYLLIAYSLSHVMINTILTLYYRLRGSKHHYGHSVNSVTRTDGDGHSTCSSGKKRGQRSIVMEMSASSSSSSASSAADSPDYSVTSKKPHLKPSFDLGRPPNDFVTAKQIGPAAQIQVFFS